MRVSVLYREPKVLKRDNDAASRCTLITVSVLYREPKVLKPHGMHACRHAHDGFSALP